MPVMLPDGTVSKQARAEWILLNLGTASFKNTTQCQLAKAIVWWVGGWFSVQDYRKPQ